MIKFTTALIAATAILGVSGPALAAKQQAKVIQKNGQTLYCVSEKSTDALIPTRTCLTKEEWEARGAKVASAKPAPVLASNPQANYQN